MTSQVPSEIMCMEHEMYTYKCTVGKTSFDLSVQQGVGARGGCAPSRAEREAEGNVLIISKTLNSRQLS